MSRPKKADKFHFENGLLKELRAKAAPVNKDIAKSARSVAKKAAKKNSPKSILAKLSSSALRRILSE